MKRFVSLVATFALTLSFALTPALADTPARIRGTVVSLDAGTLKVRTRTNEDIPIRLADNWSVIGVVKASVDDIKPGVFVGTASMPKGGDTDGEALELVLFPEAMRGTGEGHYPWDLQPGSQMANATVASQVEGVQGRTLTLRYPGGEKKITLPLDVPIVTFAPATQADITPGAPVFVPGQRKDDGTIHASRVLVGKGGTVPPM